MLKKPTALFLCLGLTLSPLMAAAPGTASAGRVIAGGAMVGSTAMPKGSTLFVGDMVKAGKESALIQLENKGRMELFPSSSVQVTGGGSDMAIRLSNGKVAYHFPKGTTARIQTAHSTMTLAVTSDRFYGVVETGASGDTIKALQGEVTVKSESTGETATVKAGNQATVASAAATPTETKKKKRRGLPIIIAALGAGAAGATYGLLHGGSGDGGGDIVTSPSGQ